MYVCSGRVGREEGATALIADYPLVQHTRMPGEHIYRPGCQVVHSMKRGLTG